MSSDPFMSMLAPSSGERILDVGAGKGQVANRVMLESKGADVYAVDPNEKRVASMKAGFPAIKSSVAGAESLPFPDAHFDKVYTTMALHHFSDLDRALSEITRVLKQGGSFVILDVEPRSGLAKAFKFFGRLMGERMNFMTMDQLSRRLEGAGGLKVTRSEKLGPRYLIQTTRP